MKFVNGPATPNLGFGLFLAVLCFLSVKSDPIGSLSKSYTLTIGRPANFEKRSNDLLNTTSESLGAGSSTDTASAASPHLLPRLIGHMSPRCRCRHRLLALNYPPIDYLMMTCESNCRLIMKTVKEIGSSRRKID